MTFSVSYEINPAEYAEILKTCGNSSAKGTSNFKEFAAKMESLLKKREGEYSGTGDAGGKTEGSAYGNCANCCGVPQNKVSLTGFVSRYCGRGFSETYFELDLPEVAHPLRIYLRGSARNVKLGAGERVRVAVSFEPNHNGDGVFYVYSAEDVHQVKAEGGKHD